MTSLNFGFISPTLPWKPLFSAAAGAVISPRSRKLNPHPAPTAVLEPINPQRMGKYSVKKKAPPSTRAPRRERVPAPPPPRSNPPPSAYPSAPQGAVPASTRARLVALVAARNHARVVGAARGGRMRAVAEGLAQRGAERVLVLAPTREAALRCAAEIEAGYPAAHLVTLAGFGNPDAIRTPVKLMRRAQKCVLVGIPRAIVEEVARWDKGKEWLHAVDAVVMYDMEFLREVGAFKEMRTLVRLALHSRDIQAIVVMDRAEPGVLARVVPYILPEKHQVIRWFDSSVPSADRDVQRIDQHRAIVPQTPRALTHALAAFVHSAKARGRVIVFFPTGRLAQVYTAMVSATLSLQVLQVHSKKTARHCTRDLAAFRADSSAVLFSSDSSARGSELEHVPTVIQVGAPMSKALYETRLQLISDGGRSISLLWEFEDSLFSSLLPSSEVVAEEIPAFEPDAAEPLPPFAGLESLEESVIAAAYLSWLTFYFTRMSSLSWTRQELAAQAARWAENEIGRTPPPAISLKSVKRFGLKDVDDVSILPEVVLAPKRRKGLQGKAFSRVKHRERCAILGKEEADKILKARRSNRVRRRKKMKGKKKEKVKEVTSKQ